MRVLVLGAYGLIGSAAADRLLVAGFRVVRLGRSVEAAPRARPEIDWRSADVARLLRPEDWAPFLRDVDVVVNAVGALQDSARDDVAAVQRDAMLALYAAAEAAEVTRFVQISAVGARADARTLFMRAKGEADAALAASRLDWTIRRPGPVISPVAYGGKAVLRGLAGFPLVTRSSPAARRSRRFPRRRSISRRRSAFPRRGGRGGARGAWSAAGAADAGAALGWAALRRSRPACWAIPAFCFVAAILWLMIARPEIPWIDG